MIPSDALNNNDKYPNEHLKFKINSLIGKISNFNSSYVQHSTTELDSHKNTALVGKDCYIFDHVNERTCDIEPFDPSVGKKSKVTIVDTAIIYGCPYTHKSYLLVIKNALDVSTLTHNLLSPFILREAGITVNDVPTIHVDNPSTIDHAIVLPSITIPLKLKRDIFLL